MSFPEGWTKRVAVTVDNAAVGTGGVTDFPILITEASLPAGIFTDALSTGADIRVTTDTAGENQVPVDVSLFNAGGSKAAIRFKGNLGTAADTVFYVWYGNSSATLPADDSQFGRNAVYISTIKALHDLEDTLPGSAGSIEDRTSNSADGTSSGSMTTGDNVAVKVHNGFDFDGSNDYMEFNPGLLIEAAADNSINISSLTGGTHAPVGMAYDPDDDALLVGFYRESPATGLIKQLSFAGAELASFDTGGINLQGVAYDTSDGTIWASVNGALKHFTKAGTLLGTVSPAFGSALHCCYDPLTDSLWCTKPSDQTHFYRVNKTTGATEETITFSISGMSVDGIAYDPATDQILLTDEGNRKIHFVAAADGTVNASYTPPGTYSAFEGLFWLNGLVYVADDTLFHSGSGTDAIHYFDPTTLTTGFSVAFWMNPASVATTKAAVVRGNPVSGTGWGIYLTTTTNARGFVKSNVSGTKDWTISTGLQHFVLTFNWTSKVVKFYQNASQVGTDWSIASITTIPEGNTRITIAASPDGDAARNLQATFDELIVTKNVLSQAWITTLYNQQNSPATFATAGTPVDTDSVAPTLGTVTIANTGLTATGTLSETCQTDASVAVTLAGTTATAVGSVSGTTFTLTFSRPITSTESVTMSMAAGQILDAAGNQIAAISGQQLVNGATPLAYRDALLLRSGLVAYWRWTEQSGAYKSWIDLLGTDWDMTVVGSPVRNTTGLLAGDSDKAINCNNAGGAAAGAGKTLDFSAPGAIEFLFKTSAANTSFLISAYDTASSVGWVVAVVSSHLYFSVSDDSAGALVGGSEVSVDDGATHHCVITWDGSMTLAGVRMYIDARRQTLQNTTDAIAGDPDSGDPVRVGCDEAGNFFSGIVDEAAIYNRTLTIGEAKGDARRAGFVVSGGGALVAAGVI